MKLLELTFLYIKKAWHFSLRDVFIYKNPDTSQKARQFALRFIYAKILTLCATQFFMEFFTLAEGEGDIFIKKKHFASDFYVKKQCTFY